MNDKILWILVGAAAAWILLTLSKQKGQPQNGDNLTMDIEPVYQDDLVSLPSPEGNMEYGQQQEALAGQDWRTADDPGVALCNKLYGYCGAPRADQLARMRQGR